MSRTVPVAVPRKGRPLEAVLERLATVADCEALADSVSSTLRYEKAITKGTTEPEHGPYERLADYSDPTDPEAPEYTLLRDSRDGFPRRVVFDSATVDCGDTKLQLIGREEPFRALRTHEFALGFDSADLVLEEVVELQPEGLGSLAEINQRINPKDTDVRVVTGLGDTVYHTLMAMPELLNGADLDRAFVDAHTGPLCISPRYERLIEAVLGTDVTDDIEFVYPSEDAEEEAAIADSGLGVYLTMTGSTAREYGLVLGEHLFPSETVLMENASEGGETVDQIKALLSEAVEETELRVQ
ncbi:hypothetical protein halTADL_0554 [Halohasta litchfieldiae]|jgi:hypothetical protein|uniref:ATP phosphoribosyltransferase n=1 Tax=Halohasta litchfieldiae TaxID=1073996 RepID=A0A1H6Y2R5_9EURY|nr:hypothetical protein [Halohasta litchfieldiae]ATW87358.1 hypothetical protein halTADL_0554 [Halohasta litchfieldiae]SEJ31410.1 hypothetical protein SAMN05444271_14512 [Halohasta litchfieldiae]